MNYRKKWEKYYQRKIPEGFDIHHIDLNRENNDISNLLLLPAELHNEYHALLCEIKDLEPIYEIKSMYDGSNGYNSYLINRLTKFVDVYNECSCWKDQQDSWKMTLNFINKRDRRGNDE